MFNKWTSPSDCMSGALSPSNHTRMGGHDKVEHLWEAEILTIDKRLYFDNHGTTWLLLSIFFKDCIWYSCFNVQEGMGECSSWMVNVNQTPTWEPTDDFRASMWLEGHRRLPLNQFWNPSLWHHANTRTHSDEHVFLPVEWQCFLVYPVAIKTQSATSQHWMTPNKLDYCSN